MIASITGKLSRKETDYLIVDVAGVGYQVHVPLSTYYRIPEAGEGVSLHIYTHLREDSLSLFGFLTQAEKDMFLALLGVSGVGPKLALAVLSSLSVEDVAAAIHAADDSRLCTIPGIGKKTAGRIILELKDKIKRIAQAAPAHERPPAGASGDFEDALSALVNLGYKKNAAEEALRKLQHDCKGLRVEELIREALNVMMKR